MSAPYRQGRKPYVKCRCACGTQRGVQVDSLCAGRSKGCGCRLSGRGRPARHGFACKGNPQNNTYQSWAHMRYFVEKRGVRVAPRWQVFEEFLADMGPCPVGKMLGRLHPSRGYHVNNCVWTQHERFNNRKRTTFWVTWKGRSQSLADLARLENVNYEKLRGRLRKTSIEALREIVQQLRAEGSTYVPYIDRRPGRRRPKSWRHEIRGDERRSMPVGVPVLDVA
jgi:hypothetical protein